MEKKYGLNMIEQLKITKKLKLPTKYYGPFCIKILKEFINHNKLSIDLEMPNKDEVNHQALSKIFDIILHSMGPEKHDEYITELNRYKMDIPAHFRN